MPSDSGQFARKERGDKMKKSALVVLEEGNDSAFSAPLAGCCFMSMMPFL